MNLPTEYRRTLPPPSWGPSHTTVLLRLSIALAICVIYLAGGKPVNGREAPAPQPIYWKERLLKIPYQIHASEEMRRRLGQVELLLSRDGITGWVPLSRAKPNLQGFRYHAPADGDYWFSVRTFDSGGTPTATGPPRPQLHVVIDTQDPSISLNGALNAEGAIVLHYEASDANLHAASFVMEVRTNGRDWSGMSIGPPDMKQPDRIIGQVQWSPPRGTILSKPDTSPPFALESRSTAGDQNIAFRAYVADRAGHRSIATTRVALDGPQLGSPDATLTKRRGTSELGQYVLDWPPQETLGENTSDRISAQFASNTQQNRSPRLSASRLEDEPLPEIAPNLPNGPLTFDKSPAAELEDGWSEKSLGSLAHADSTMRMVNNRTFDVEYELNSVGPWGISKVELWGTSDGGQTWENYTVDPDNRTPVRVTVPAGGTYGFRILVDGVTGALPHLPSPGDRPELVVQVDLEPPVVELHKVEHGRDNLKDHLLIHWNASDTNLEPRPIAISFSTLESGPWSMIASGLINTGHYAWRLERHVPEQFYLRVEVRDTAGNVATSVSPTPITLDRPQPVGRLRTVRPVVPPFASDPLFSRPPAFQAPG